MAIAWYTKQKNSSGKVNVFFFLTSHLNLLVFKYIGNAGVEGGAREHGGDGIG